MDNTPLHLLHVEDDDGDAKEVKRACTKEFGPENFTLTRVESLEAAIQKLKDSYFDAVLLDLNLGDGQGVENVHAIKKENQDVAIVVLSGHDDTETALRCVRGGAQEYIVKSHSNSRMLGLSVRTSIERKIQERQLFQQANHDELTGLPNRRAFKEYMKQWLARAIRHERTECVMFMDVNGFKQVNDTLGHDVGDMLLKQIADTISEGLRASDMLARYAGDEFVVHLDAQAHESKETSAIVAEKINALFENPIPVGGHDINTGVSIGIAFFPEHGKDYKSLIHSADQAMYQAKQAGKSFSFADSPMR